MGAAADLLANYQHVIEGLTLTTGTTGVFDVTVDGEMLYSKHAERRHADEGEVLARFTELVGDIPRYGDE